MFDSAAFFLSWFLVFLLCGGMLYIVDRSTGVRVRRWFYDMTHEHPRSDGQEFGFIYNRPARNRFTCAVFLSVLQSVCAVTEGVSSLTNEILSVFAEVPCLMLGFYFGPLLYRVWSRREKVFDTVDQIERGDISLKEEFQEVSQKALHQVKEALTPVSKESLSTDNEMPKAKEKQPSQETDSPVDPKEFLGKYIQK